MAIFAADQITELERRISVAVDLQSENFLKFMLQGDQQQDAMASLVETHNTELHDNAIRVSCLVDQANARATFIEGSMAKIVETEGSLNKLTADLNAFAEKQEAVIAEQSVKLVSQVSEVKNLTKQTSDALITASSTPRCPTARCRSSARLMA